MNKCKLFFLLVVVVSFNLHSSNKYVLTGGPGVGKTAIITGLELMGEVVIPEVAIDYINFLLANNVQNPWFEEDFEDKIMQLQVQREKKLSAVKNRIFLDRSPVDGLAYTMFYNKKMSENKEKIIDRISSSNDYKIVFLIESLGKDVKSEQRAEDLETAIHLECFLEETYKKLGFVVKRIPAASLNTRIEMIKNIVEDYEREN